MKCIIFHVHLNQINIYLHFIFPFRIWNMRRALVFQKSIIYCIGKIFDTAMPFHYSKWLNSISIWWWRANSYICLCILYMAWPASHQFIYTIEINKCILHVNILLGRSAYTHLQINLHPFSIYLLRAQNSNTYTYDGIFISKQIVSGSKNSSYRRTRTEQILYLPYQTLFLLLSHYHLFHLVCVCAF